MGLFDIFSSKKKKKKPDIDYNLESEIKAPTVRLDKAAYTAGDDVVEVCEHLIDATYQIEDMRIEYDSVSDYYEDTQKIEQMPEMLRKELNDVAMKIEFLEKNQEEFKQLKTKLSDDKYRLMSKYEDEIPDVLRKLVDMEARLAAINRDMQYLEGEKNSQDIYVEDAEDRQYQLRTISITVVILALISGGVLAWFSYMYVFSPSIPLMLLLFAVTLVFVAIFMKYRAEEYEIKLAHVKKAKAITLLNKVKLKYVNAASTLDYIYAKYDIRSLRELEHLWEQYVELREESRRFRQSIGDMKVYFDDMERILKEINVKDPFIWTSQTRALLDEREMVEVKHNLNKRRGSIRAIMEKHENIRNECIAKMKELVKKDPGVMDSIKEILADYRITI
ncbi:MAG: hypothetical protein IKQ71_02470 [Lachnospiraceae bacterium]|nr:hypothetical protein [Lachnospiraceae bacterium]